MFFRDDRVSTTKEVRGQVRGRYLPNLVFRSYSTMVTFAPATLPAFAPALRIWRSPFHCTVAYLPHPHPPDPQSPE